MKTFTEINFGPFSHNVLDYIDKPLVTKTGLPVTLKREYNDFVVRVNGKEVYRGKDNVFASYHLNMYQVGEML